MRNSLSAERSLNWRTASPSLSFAWIKSIFAELGFSASKDWHFSERAQVSARNARAFHEPLFCCARSGHSNRCDAFLLLRETR